MTTSDAYKTYHPDHNQYWELIAAEIQRYGANSFATMLRGGKGVEKIENNLLMKILTDEIENMSPEELKELAQSTTFSFNGRLPL